MAPNSTVPVTPTNPKSGEAGAVVPTPACCQPEKKWCQAPDHEGSGANWPTRGSVPKNSSRVPSTMTSAADQDGQGALASGAERGRSHPTAEAVPPRAATEVVQLVEVRVLAEGQPHAAGELGHLVTLRSHAPGRRWRRHWPPRVPGARAG